MSNFLNFRWFRAAQSTSYEGRPVSADPVRPLAGDDRLWDVAGALRAASSDGIVSR